MDNKREAIHSTTEVNFSSSSS